MLYPLSYERVKIQEDTLGRALGSRALGLSGFRALRFSGFRALGRTSNGYPPGHLIAREPNFAPLLHAWPREDVPETDDSVGTAGGEEAAGGVEG